MLLPSTTVFCRLLVFLLVPVMLSRRLPFKKSLSSFCLPFLFRRIFLPPLPASFAVFSFGKTLRGRLRYTNPLANFSGEKGRSRVFAPRASPTGRWTLIGKLRALFNESGRRGEWDPRLLIGNPATDISLKQYLKAVTAEQLQAQSTPTQATPVFVHDLVRLSHFLDEKLLSDKLSSIEMFVLMRDQASFKTLFFSGDRAGDLGQVKTPGNPPFPRWRWFTFQSHLGKNPP